MPFLTLIWTMVISVVPYIVTWVVRGLGFGLVAYTGLTLGIDQVESYIFNQMDGLPSDLYAIISMLGVPMGIKILFTAFGVALGIKGVGNTVKPAWRKPGSNYPGIEA